MSMLHCMFNMNVALFQMSKSTGNFLTLSDAINKFSADGTYPIPMVLLMAVIYTIL